MPGDPVPREAELTAGRNRGSWLQRFRVELGSQAGEHDAFVRLIIIERIAKALVLITLAVSLIVTGRAGLLARWAGQLQQDLVLDAGSSLIDRLLNWALARLVQFRHQTILGVAIILYAGLEGAEGVGLHLRRRWAEYLTVIATGLLIPYEVWEVLHRQTLFRFGALLLNVAVVGYLAYRKRLFVGI